MRWARCIDDLESDNNSDSFALVSEDMETISRFKAIQSQSLANSQAHYLLLVYFLIKLP